MANLFQPTYRSSNLAAPTIPGADIGAFGKSIADIKLNNMKQRQFEVETKRAEEEAQWKRDDRAELENTRNFLKSYNPNEDPSRNKIAADAYNAEVKKDIESRLAKAGILDSNGKYIEGSSYDSGTLGQIDNISSKVSDSVSSVPILKRDRFNSVYAKVIEATGNPEIAHQMATAASSNDVSREQLQKDETTRVKSLNEAIDKRQALLTAQTKLDAASGKKSDFDKGSYAPDYSALQGKDFDVSLVDTFGGGDAGRVKDTVNTGMRLGIPAWAVDKAISNSIVREASGDHLMRSEKDILALATTYQSGKAVGSKIPLLTRASERSVDDILRTQGSSAYNRLGNPTSSRAKAITTGSNTSDVVFGTPPTVTPPVVTTPTPKKTVVEVAPRVVLPIDEFANRGTVPNRLPQTGSYTDRLQAANANAGGFTPQELVKWTKENPNPDNIPLDVLLNDTLTPFLKKLWDNRNRPIRESL